VSIEDVQLQYSCLGAPQVGYGDRLDIVQMCNCSTDAILHHRLNVQLLHLEGKPDAPPPYMTTVSALPLVTVNASLWLHRSACHVCYVTGWAKAMLVFTGDLPAVHTAGALGAAAHGPQ